MELTDLFRLDGKVAVVTGASYGLGCCSPTSSLRRAPMWS
jgi:hypothetical protein